MRWFARLNGDTKAFVSFGRIAKPCSRQKPEVPPQLQRDERENSYGGGNSHRMAGDDPQTREPRSDRGKDVVQRV